MVHGSFLNQLQVFTPKQEFGVTALLHRTQQNLDLSVYHYTSFPRFDPSLNWCEPSSETLVSETSFLHSAELFYCAYATRH